MKHLNAEKYNLAWFKLAECVSRKEKERALGVYRLLSHSLGNDALATQLYGDLLLGFNDKAGAIEKYLQAADIYKKSENTIEAIAVYEHLLFLQSDEIKYFFDLFDLYAKINMQFKIVDHTKKLIKNKNLKRDMVMQTVKKAIDCLLKSGDDRILRDFVNFLKTDSPELYSHFTNYADKL